MIFSGCVSFYKCEACASKYSNVTPTSLLPIAVVVVIATGPWTRVLSRVVPFKWLAVVFGVAVSMASLWLIYSLIEALTTGKLRRGICPKCGAKLTPAGRGFYDGIVPNAWESLIYILVIAMAFGVAAATRPST